jgi:quercetin dioxygenase-like cupin family protein
MNNAGEMTMDDHAIVHMPDEGTRITMRGAAITLKAVSDDTGGAWSLMEYTAPPHFAGPPPHWHNETLEGFYILSGTVTFQVDAQTIIAPAGSFVLVPPGVIHTFANQEDVPATFLTVVSPGGFERYFDELAALVAHEPTWPPADPSKLTALMMKYDTYAPPVEQLAL